jgi:chitin disaccharide deacetylase
MADVIITADDYGFSGETAEATEKQLKRGSATGASIMAKMPATNRAATFARSHPEFSFGIHLVFVGSGVERPISSPSDVRGLVGRDGAFLPLQAALLRTYSGRVSGSMIEREARAQIEHLLNMDVNIEYADSHGHIHKQGTFMSVLGRVLPAYGIRCLRRPQNIWLENRLGLKCGISRALYASVPKELTTTSLFFGATSVEDSSELARIGSRIDQESLEIGFHPGVTTEWRRTEGQQVAELLRTLEEEGHRVVSWRDVLQSASQRA